MIMHVKSRTYYPAVPKSSNWNTITHRWLWDMDMFWVLSNGLACVRSTIRVNSELKWKTNIQYVVEWNNHFLFVSFGNLSDIWHWSCSALHSISRFLFVQYCAVFSINHLRFTFQWATTVIPPPRMWAKRRVKSGIETFISVFHSRKVFSQFLLATPI